MVMMSSSWMVIGEMNDRTTKGVGGGNGGDEGGRVGERVVVCPR
jgi:hypothetical protein